MQIQDRFESVPLEVIARAGLGAYELIPDFRESCPICRGSDCALRHGLYRRTVVAGDGSVYPDFPVPRFRCQGRGTLTPLAVTFSVLPVALVSRRRLSLSVMVWVMDLLLLAERTLHEVLDSLSDTLCGSSQSWFPDPPVIYRVLDLFARAEGKLELLGALPRTAENARRSPRCRARRVLRVIGAPARAAPLALRFHRLHFPRMLFAPLD